MAKSVLSRIEELERQKPSSIICLARNIKTGEEREMPILELVELGVGTWDMVKVVEGSSLDDIHAYLDAMTKYFGWCEF